MPDRALIVVDMLQTYEHEDAETLRENVEEVLPQIRGLVERARDAGAPVIYVNDSFGDWRGDRRAFLDEMVKGPHARLVEPILPAEDAQLITKARHSIFYETQLEYLLREHEVERVVLVGQVTEQCILYSALDAYVRRFQVAVPRDAVASIDADLADAALRMMERNMQAEVTTSGDVEL